MLCHTECFQACRQLDLSDRSENMRWKLLRVGRAALAAGGSCYYDSMAGSDGLRHECRRQVGLVIGVRPHSQNGLGTG